MLSSFQPHHERMMNIKNNLNECTFHKTGQNYTEQFWKRCYDCFPNTNEGACLNCINICHDGHNIGTLQKGHFFVIVANKVCVKILGHLK